MFCLIQSFQEIIVVKYQNQNIVKYYYNKILQRILTLNAYLFKHTTANRFETLLC